MINLAMINWVELSQRSSCHKRSNCLVGQVFLGRVVTRVELSQGLNCHKGRIVTRVELSQGSSCHKGRVVTRVEMR